MMIDTHDWTGLKNVCRKCGCLRKDADKERCDKGADRSLTERKAKAFDWLIGEITDEESNRLMRECGHKTPLEGIEKAMAESS